MSKEKGNSLIRKWLNLSPQERSRRLVKVYKKPGFIKKYVEDSTRLEYEENKSNG